MPITETIRLAFKSLWTSKMRSFLTMLGIIIGVAAVIIITAVGNGMENYVRDMFQSFGTNLMNVRIFNTPTRSVDIDDIYAYIDSKPEYFKGVTPEVSVSAQLKHNQEKFDTSRLSGVAENFGQMSNFKLTAGRFIKFMDVKAHKKVCVIGSYVNTNYYDGDGFGKTVKINGDKYQIIGILAETAASEKRGDDDTVYIPYTLALKINNTRSVDSFTVQIASEEIAPMAKADIEQYLYDIFQDEEYYYVVTMAEILGQMSQLLNIIVFVLSAIAAISLVVGGIGIMNITLVSVTERTREIGIRKALGAKKRHIMQQFLIEAATTSGVGGLIGIGMGMGLSSLFSVIIKSALNADMTLLPKIPAIMLAFSVSVTIGIVFGFLPARKAAGLSPIDALRYE